MSLNLKTTIRITKVKEIPKTNINVIDLTREGDILSVVLTLDHKGSYVGDGRVYLNVMNKSTHDLSVITEEIFMRQLGKYFEYVEGDFNVI